VRLQDDVAQVGQGWIAERSRERLGRSDMGVLFLRRIWLRELRALAEGWPLKRWSRPPGLAPTAWCLPGKTATESGGTNLMTRAGTPQIVDVRPRVEVAQL